MGLLQSERIRTYVNRVFREYAKEWVRRSQALQFQNEGQLQGPQTPSMDDR